MRRKSSGSFPAAASAIRRSIFPRPSSNERDDARSGSRVVDSGEGRENGAALAGTSSVSYQVAGVFGFGGVVVSFAYSKMAAAITFPLNAIPPFLPLISTV